MCVISGCWDSVEFTRSPTPMGSQPRSFSLCLLFHSDYVAH